MRRGEVWWANLGPPRGTRPVLLVMRDRAYAIRESVTIAPLTRTIRTIPSYVRVGPEDGLDGSSVVDLDDLQTMPKVDLKRRITTLSPERMAEVDRAIKFALALR